MLEVSESAPSTHIVARSLHDSMMRFVGQWCSLAPIEEDENQKRMLFVMNQLRTLLYKQHMAHMDCSKKAMVGIPFVSTHNDFGFVLAVVKAQNRMLVDGVGSRL